MLIFQLMNVLKTWLEKNRGEGRQALLAQLRKTYPRISSTSLSQYAHGHRIPEKGKAEIIARFIGVSLEQIPFRMVNRPDQELKAGPVAGKLITANDPGNGGRPESTPRLSFLTRIFGGKTEASPLASGEEAQSA